MMEQLDGNIAVNAEKSQKSSLLSVEDWSAFNKELLSKKPAPLSNDGMLEFSNPFGDKKNAVGKTETMNSDEAGDKLRALKKMKEGGDKEDSMRQLKKEKAEHNSTDEENRQIKKLKAFAAGKAEAAADGSKPEKPADGGIKDIIKKPSAETDGGVKKQKELSSEPDGVVHQEGKVTKDGGLKEKVAPNNSDELTPMEGKEPKDGGVKEQLTDSASHSDTSESAPGDRTEPEQRSERDLDSDTLEAKSLAQTGWTVHADGTISPGRVRSQGQK